MAKKRTSKSVLGQTAKKKVVEEEKVEEVVENTTLDPIEEIAELAEEAVQPEIPFEEPIVETSVEEELVAPEQPVEAEEVVEEAPVVKKVSELNEAEYRYYLNTGKIPQ